MHHGVADLTFQVSWILHLLQPVPVRTVVVKMFAGVTDETSENFAVFSNRIVLLDVFF